MTTAIIVCWALCAVASIGGLISRRWEWYLATLACALVVLILLFAHAR